MIAQTPPACRRGGDPVKVYVFPADLAGCGLYRMIWPARALQRDGHDVTIVTPRERGKMLSAEMDVNGRIVNVITPECDVIVFQRVTHRLIAEAIPVIRRKGITVVVDMDDDLSRIHPGNPAFTLLHPRSTGDPRTADHSWQHVQRACDLADLVTVSTPALLDRYAKHGRGRVVPNYIPEAYLSVPHWDSAVVGWGGSIHSHPDDLQTMGPAVQRHVRGGGAFMVAGSGDGVAQVLNLGDYVPPTTGVTDPGQPWAEALTTLGIGIAPLADTRFNAAKSWLKPLEYSAVGLPWVASPRAEYARLHKTYKIGLLAKTPNDWYRQLERLSKSVALRGELGAAARVAATGLTIEKHADEWLDAWTSAVEWARVPSRAA